MLQNHLAQPIVLRFLIAVEMLFIVEAVVHHEEIEVVCEISLTIVFFRRHVFEWVRHCVQH